jgi:hypothetical protein
MSPRVVDQAEHRPLLLSVGSFSVFPAWADRLGRQIVRPLVVFHVQPRAYAGDPQQLRARPWLAKGHAHSLRQFAAQQPTNAKEAHR